MGGVSGGLWYRFNVRRCTQNDRSWASMTKKCFLFVLFLDLELFPTNQSFPHLKWLLNYMYTYVSFVF
jgi:hypothetical protein